jgi:hypothetical protein
MTDKMQGHIWAMGILVLMVILAIASGTNIDSWVDRKRARSYDKGETQITCQSNSIWASI